MAEREERRFAEVPRESVKLMAESAGVELGDDVAALLAEDVCYRLREATQVRTGERVCCAFCPSQTGCPRFWLTLACGSFPTEQLPVHETCQAPEADSGGL